MRQALLALAGTVSEVLDGLFHAERHVGELIEVFGQVAGKALLLREARSEQLFDGLRAGRSANAIDGGAHLARAAFIFGLGMLGMVAADVVTYPKRIVAGCKERAIEHQMVDMDEALFGVLGLGLRRGKVDGDGIELACGK